MERTEWAWGMPVVFAMFPSSAHSNIVRYFNLIETALAKFGINEPDVKLVAYATIRAETSGFAPIVEGESKYNTVKIPQELTPYAEEDRYSLYEQKKKLGNDRIGDGFKYIGRGFVQLTGKANYLKYGQRIGLGSSLVENPRLANDPKLAAQILAAYMQENSSVIAQAIKMGNLKLARRAVNGGLNGLEHFEQAYKIGHRLINGGVTDSRSIA